MCPCHPACLLAWSLENKAVGGLARPGLTIWNYHLQQRTYRSVVTEEQKTQSVRSCGSRAERCQAVLFAGPALLPPRPPRRGRREERKAGSLQHSTRESESTDVFAGNVISDFTHKVKLSGIPDILHDRLKVLGKQIHFCDLADLARSCLACSSDKCRFVALCPAFYLVKTVQLK